MPVPSTVTEADWPLITYEEALALGELEDHAEIEALIERACRARVERFADSTDMSSLVYAKSADAPRTAASAPSRASPMPTPPMHAKSFPRASTRLQVLAG